MSDVSVFVWILFLAHIAIALVLCFWGNRYFRQLISIYVFLFVFPMMMNMLESNTGMSESTSIMIALFVAIGATALTWIIYKVAIFALGGFLGYNVVTIFTSGAEMSTVSIVIGIILFVIVGILALKFRKVVIILASAIIGAFSLFVYGYYILFNFGSIPALDFTEAAELPMQFSEIIGTNYILYLIPIVLAILGMLSQTRAGRRRAASRERKKEREY